MPELVDVEVFRQYINSTSLHQPIEHTHVEDARILADVTPQALGRALKNNQFDSTRRHGKHLFIELHDGGWLAMHFGMTGSVDYFGADKKPPDFAQVLITFKNGNQLAYLSRRKLGRVTLANDLLEFIEKHELGPDALALSPAEFKQLAVGRHGVVKTWLMDQQIMAGIGNVYSDEILFQARIHPKRNLNELDKADFDALYRSMHRVLDAAINAHADPEAMPDNFLIPHRKSRSKCPSCGGDVKRISVGGRSAWFCPRCQT